MNRREFSRNILCGAGGLTLLNASSPLRAASIWHHGAKTRSLSVRIGKTVEITRSKERCWFPSLHQFPNKDLIATMSMNADSTHPPEGFRSAYCISHDQGATWSPRYRADTVRGVWAEIPGPGGCVWGLSGHIVGAHGDQDFLFGRSQLFDPGTSPEKSGIKVEPVSDALLHVSEPTLGIMFTGSILPSHGDSLVGCIYSRIKQAPKYYQLATVHSDDNGQTWREGTVIASLAPDAQPWPGMGTEGPCEAGLVRLRDGRLFVIFRTGSDGDMGTTWSSDEGKTWKPPTRIPYKGVEPRVRLLSSGILACSTGRPGPVRMMFSLDGTGKTWSHETPVFHDMSTRYTEFVEIAPGKLFLVYDSVPYGWKEIPATDEKAENVIYGTYIDVELHS